MDGERRNEGRPVRKGGYSSRSRTDLQLQSGVHREGEEDMQVWRAQLQRVHRGEGEDFRSGERPKSEMSTCEASPFSGGNTEETKETGEEKEGVADSGRSCEHGERVLYLQ